MWKRKLEMGWVGVKLSKHVEQLKDLNSVLTTGEVWREDNLPLLCQGESANSWTQTNPMVDTQMCLDSLITRGADFEILCCHCSVSNPFGWIVKSTWCPMGGLWGWAQCWEALGPQHALGKIGRSTRRMAGLCVNPVHPGVFLNRRYRVKTVVENNTLKHSTIS